MPRPCVLAFSCVAAVAAVGWLLAPSYGFQAPCLPTSNAALSLTSRRPWPTSSTTTTARTAPVLRANKYVDASGEPIKGALTSYMHFCQDERQRVTAELKRELGDKFKSTLVLSRLGEEWGEISTKRLSHYEALAAADKARFQKAIAAPGVAKVEKVAGRPGRKRKEKPSSSGQKGASSAAKPRRRTKSGYLLFCDEMRDKVATNLRRKMGDSFKYQAVMAALGEEWAALDANKKSRFNDAAAELKRRAAEEEDAE